jgi:hypothetical protein
MRHIPHRAAVWAIPALLLTCPGLAFAAAANNNAKADSGAVVLSIPPPISQDPSAPPLNLTERNARRSSGR